MTEVIKVENCGENIGDYDIPIHNAIIISEGATNGDMIKAMFPNGTESIGRKKIYYSFYPNGDMEFNITWWNALYKKEVEE